MREKLDPLIHLQPMVFECCVLLCWPLWCHPVCQRIKININMALVIVTSVPNKFLMITPFCISVGDLWYIVVTEKSLFWTPNGHHGKIYTIQSQLYRSAVNLWWFITAFFYLVRFPGCDHLSSTNHKLLFRTTARHSSVYMRKFIHIYGYLQV